MSIHFNPTVSGWGYNTIITVRVYDRSNNLIPFYYEHYSNAFEDDSWMGTGDAAARKFKMVGNSGGEFEWNSQSLHAGYIYASVDLIIKAKSLVSKLEVEFSKRDESLTSRPGGDAIFTGQMWIWASECGEDSNNQSSSSSSSNNTLIFTADGF